jgi:hypothetical protein
MDAPATEPRPAADRHDVVLALALGALAAAQRFERAVSVRSADDDALGPDDPVVLAALGAIALGRTLRHWLESAADPRPGLQEQPMPAKPPETRELLR